MRGEEGGSKELLTASAQPIERAADIGNVFNDIVVKSQSGTLTRRAFFMEDDINFIPVVDHSVFSKGELVRWANVREEQLHERGGAINICCHF